jgi:threonine/homoserine/homoserine lactone efflux protein
MILPDPALFTGFMIAAIAVNLTPGPDIAYVATRTLAEGRAAGVAGAFGIAAGTLVHTLLAALGLSSLFTYAPVAFDVVKYAGAAYLVWIAIRLWCQGNDGDAATPIEAPGVGRAFVDGALTNILNPKVALFFLALLPQFVDQGKGGIASQMIVLGLAFNTTGTLVNVAIALVTARARGVVQASPFVTRVIRRLTAAVFLGLAARLALVQRS